MSTPPESRAPNLADRAAPPCPHFGPCGGCQLQNLTYAAQLRLKSARLAALLEATSLALPTLELHASPPLAYRNRIRLTLAEVAGQLRAGYLTRPTQPKTDWPTSGPSDLDVDENEPSDFARQSERPAFLPITQCPIAAPILWRATEALLALINESPAHWLRNPQFKLDQLELLTAVDESSLQFSLYLRTAAKSLPAKLTTAFSTLCEALRVSLPECAGADIAILPLASPNRSRRNEQPRPGPTWGKLGLNYTVAPLEPQPPDPSAPTYWLPRGAFFQSNRFLLPELLTLVTANRSGKLAWDLYAGVGLFARALARSFPQVTAVEIAEPAASALASTKLSNLRAIHATTLDFLRAAVTDRDRPDLIVLDPPRTGAGPEICALLGRIAAPTLIYVSCSPDTLPADLVTLTATGYRVAELHFIDLFPQTDHIETVAILSR